MYCKVNLAQSSDKEKTKGVVDKHYILPVLVFE
jgi:hypothetical protein